MENNYLIEIHKNGKTSRYYNLTIKRNKKEIKIAIHEDHYYYEDKIIIDPN